MLLIIEPPVDIGRGVSNIEEVTGLTVEFSLVDLEDTIKKVIASGGEFQIMPRGQSMLPLIRERIDAVALVRPPDVLRRGDIVLCRRDSGTYVLHRIIGTDDSGFIICGDNQTVPERCIERRQIAACAAAVVRGGKRRNLRSFPMRIYTVLWCCMPLRRVVRRIGGSVRRLKKNSGRGGG